MLGGLFALLAAASFALNSATARRAVLSGSVFQGIAITVPMGIPMFLIGAIVFGQIGVIWTIPLEAVGWLALAGVAHFVWGRYFFYRAQEMIGANLAGTMQQFDLLLSLALAIVILGEVLTPLRLLGIALVLIGPALAFSGTPHSVTAQSVTAQSNPTVKPLLSKPARFQPRYFEGYVYIALAALGYGFSPTLTRLGLLEIGTHAGLVGGLIACGAATLAFALFLAVTGRVAHVLATNRQTLVWFGAAGISVSVSQMLRFTALSLAPVTVVQPIQRLSKLFLFGFSWLMNREHEVFSGRLALAAVVALAGAVMLSASTEMVLHLAPWPDWFVTLARWQWP